MIEDNLNRIADALEGILGKLSHIDAAVKPKKAAAKKPADSVTTPVTSTVTTPSAPVPVVTPTPPPVAPAAPVVVTPPAPKVVTPPPAMTPEELNAALGVEFGRLGGREPIDAAMRDMGVSSIHDLQPEQFTVLLDKVKAL